MKPRGIGRECILEKVRGTLFIALFGLGNLFPLRAAVFPEVSIAWALHPLLLLSRMAPL